MKDFIKESSFVFFVLIVFSFTAIFKCNAQTALSVGAKNNVESNNVIFHSITGYINVSLNREENPVVICKVYNIWGIRLRRKKMASDRNLYIGRLKIGKYYVIKVRSCKTGEVYRKKIFIEHPPTYYF